MLMLMLPLALAARPKGGEPLRGKLVQRAGKAPAIDAGGRLVTLDGDAESMAVLADARLAGADLELLGRRAGDRFIIGPFYESRSMFVHRGGKRYTISYWCATCSIRTYTPGKCMCCREETELSLQEDPQQ